MRNKSLKRFPQNLRQKKKKKKIISKAVIPLLTVCKSEIQSGKGALYIKLSILQENILA